MSEYGIEAGVPNPAIQQYEDLFNKHSALERWRDRAVKLLEQANDHIENQDKEIAALRGENVCKWWYEEVEDAWNTSCNNLWQFMNDGPKENDCQYCMYCGGKIALLKDGG